MKNKGFTIIELLIVIAIIGILVGIAVPYYNDYIYEARLSLLKQNLTAWRNAINQFRGDNQRGPLLAQVTGSVTHSNPRSSNDSELTAGPIQIIDGNPMRRSNIQYLPRLPILQDPATGADIPVASWTLGGSTAFYYDDGDNIFDIDTEWAFIDGNGNGAYDTADDAKFDTGILYVPLPAPDAAYDSTSCKPLDYTTINVTTSDGSIF